MMRRCAHPYDQLDMDQASGVGAGNSYGVGQLLVEPRAIKEIPSQFDLPGNTYLDQRFFMKDAFFWPRAERAPQGESKVDQVLASHTLGSACSSFIVEWTWGEGVGEAIVPRDQVPPPDGIMSTEPRRDFDCWHGVHYDAADPLLVIPDTDDPAWASTEPWLDQRWFGLRDIERGVMSFEEFQENFPRGSNNLCDVTYSGTMAPYALGTDAYAIDDDVQSGFGQNTPYEEYWATFGYNQEDPSLPLDVDGDETRDVDPSFAPWPTALRITMTLHDPEGRLAQGQVYQFVVQLPGQAQGQLAGGR